MTLHELLSHYVDRTVRHVKGWPHCKCNECHLEAYIDGRPSVTPQTSQSPSGEGKAGGDGGDGRDES